ncbi:MAG: glycoside hydrolase family 3 N-terminal domain-containing protein [Sphingobacteriia bacterium]|jgi:beta-glucosidase
MLKHWFIISVIGCCLMIVSNESIAQSTNSRLQKEGWIDFNKNGIKDIFEDPKQPIQKRVANLLAQMNVDEKTAQLVTLYGYGRVLKDELPTPAWKNKIWKDGIANIDEHLNSTTFRPSTFTKYSFPYSRHAEAINTVQQWFIEETRLGIPVDFTNEGIHGLANEKATALPAPIAIGSTWNKALINQAGHIVGREAKALGYTNVYVPILDLARDPRWGRVVECYGEDPFLVTELGKQMVLGVQAENVASTLKHYMGYSVPKGGRDGNARTDPHIAPRELFNMYLYPYERIIKEAHPLGIMSSYNDWDGMPVTGSYYFLTELLRKKFGFDGYVVSDSDALEFIYAKHHVAKDSADAVKMALEAGMNVRTNFQNPETFLLPARKLVKDGMLSMKTLDARVGEVLNYKFKMGLFDHPFVVDTKKADAIVNNAEAKAFSKQISKEALVLLKNDQQLLPLNKNKVSKILVTGPLANDTLTSMSRYGPSNVKVISVLEGLKSYLGSSVNLQYSKGCESTDDNWPESELFPTTITSKEQASIDSAVRIAQNVDVIIAVMGETENQFGESRSRTNLDLTGRQLLLLQALYATGKPVVMVLINGQPLTINWPAKYLPAIIEAWCPGVDGGSAIAETIFGDYNPGGKLSVTFPKSVGQIELNFPFKPGSHAGQPGDGPNGFGKTNVYGALYPFGFGLSYTSFKYSNLTISPEKQNGTQKIDISVDITNTGKYKGDEVVQLYFKDEVSSVTVYETQLRGFERISLNVGETKTVRFTLSPKDISLLDKNMQSVVEPGVFEILVGSSSEDIRVKKKFIVQ